MAKTRLGTNVKKTVLTARFRFREELGRQKKKKKEGEGGEDKDDKDDDDIVVVLDDSGIVKSSSETETGGKEDEEADEYRYGNRKVVGIDYKVLIWNGKVITTEST